MAPALAGLLLLCTVTLGASSPPTPSRPALEHAPVVQELVTLLDSNATLRASVEEALRFGESTHSLPRNLTWDEIYEFFDNWLVYAPTVDNVPKYTHAFQRFYTNNPFGLNVTLQPESISWLQTFVEARGDFLSSNASVSTLPGWISDPAVAIHDFIVPEGGFKSFNDFFTRHFKEGRRPIEAPVNNSVIVSPADCEISTLNLLTPTSLINLKGDNVNVTTMLGGGPIADLFVHGSMLELGLGLLNYHRFHSPVSGVVVDIRWLDGLIFGWYFGHMEDYLNSFTRCHRGVWFIDNAEFGVVAVVAVGARTVNSIQSQVKVGDLLAKGDPLGFFAFGGSSMGVLFSAPYAQQCSDRQTMWQFLIKRSDFGDRRFEAAPVVASSCPHIFAPECYSIKVGQEVATFQP